ncbi:hypothetical protein OG613_27805 [Streptomyces sp. NBC_00015]|uniref:hypothetical protein n=1 Tax=Streptomyces sp. NBC_00015 TaxID=2903611 RepID=UPI0032502536
MTWLTTPPGAALRILRVLRGAAGRRVVQLALLVGGLFALGFLCGEQAHAAEGLTAPALTAPALPAPARSAAALPSPDLPPVLAVPAAVTDQVEGLSSGPAVGDVGVAAVGEQRARLLAQVSPPPVSSSPRQPIEQALPEVSDPSGLPELPELSDLPVLSDRPVLPDLPELVDLPELADRPKVPEVSGLTALPSLPALPDLPALPVLPALPSFPALPALPALSDLPDLAVLPAVPAVPAVPVSAKVMVADTAVDADTASYGPVGTGVGGSVDAGHRVASLRTGHAPANAPAHAPGPVRRGPAGDRDGVLGGGASVFDGGASRHGDTYAVTPRHRIPLRLVPGSAARPETAGTRDGHRNIPVFPG